MNMPKRYSDDNHVDGHFSAPLSDTDTLRGMPALAPLTQRARRLIGAEIWIVLGLSLGKSGVYALVNIIAMLTATAPLGQHTTSIVVPLSPRPYLDLTFQILGIFFALIPVALVLYLLSQHGRGALRSIGLDGSRPWRDTGIGFGLAAVIGIPGLGLYALGRAIGITVEIQTSTLNSAWWTVPILILAALQNGILEEIIAVAYLTERLGDLRWRTWSIITASALLRGSYHLYQGIGPFFGNVAMGFLFAWFYQSKWGGRRVMPLIIAHTLLDIVAFVGYALLPAAWLKALGVN